MTWESKRNAWARKPEPVQITAIVRVPGNKHLAACYSLDLDHKVMLAGTALNLEGLTATTANYRATNIDTCRFLEMVGTWAHEGTLIDIYFNHERQEVAI